MSEIQNNPELVIKTMKAVAFVLVPLGGFLILKEQFTDIILIDFETDKMLGYAMIFVGLVDYFVVPKILKNTIEKSKKDD